MFNLAHHNLADSWSFEKTLWQSFPQYKEAFRPSKPGQMMKSLDYSHTCAFIPNMLITVTTPCNCILVCSNILNALMHTQIFMDTI